jgi:hypothetical protein
MLTLSRDELSAMSKVNVIVHVLSLQAEKEVFEKLHPSVLAAMSKEDLVTRAVVLQSEIEWRKLQHMTSGGAG